MLFIIQQKNNPLIPKKDLYFYFISSKVFKEKKLCNAVNFKALFVASNLPDQKSKRSHSFKCILSYHNS